MNLNIKKLVMSFLTFGIFFGFIFFVFDVEQSVAAVCNCGADCFNIGGDIVDQHACEAIAGCGYKRLEGLDEAVCPVIPIPTPSEVPDTGEIGPPAPTIDPQVVSLTNPLSRNITDVPTLIGMIIKGALSLVGAISLFVFIMGGFEWLTSAGNQEKVGKGAKTMMWAVIGLLLVFASYMIVNLLLKV